MTEILPEQLEAEQSMFVQTAQGSESDGAKLTLQGITPSTLYFSDRPQRVVGHMATTDFVDLWAVGDNSFETDPPNAVLSFLESGADAPVDAVVVLTAPSLVGDGDLSYSIDVLDGAVPAHTGPVTLFIDPFGRPLSPVSVCGSVGASGGGTGAGSEQPTGQKEEPWTVTISCSWPAPTPRRGRRPRTSRR